MSRHTDGIDMMKLFALGSTNGWNDFLSRCYLNNDINELARVKYQIEVGMTDLAKKNIKTQFMDLMFVKMGRSLEITAKMIIKKMYPMPTDSISKSELDLISKADKDKIQKAKRARDAALAEFFRKSSF